jgi:hypothetical protein
VSEGILHLTRNEACRCDWGDRPLGRLYGINMGIGRVRIATHPKCPVHALCQSYTSRVRAEREGGKWLYCNVHKTKDCPS